MPVRGRLLVASIFSLWAADLLRYVSRVPVAIQMLPLVPVMVAAGAIHLKHIGAQVAARATWWSLALCATFAAVAHGGRIAVGLMACAVGALFAAGVSGLESGDASSPFTPVAFRRLLVVSMIATAGEAVLYAVLGTSSLLSRTLEPCSRTPAPVGPMVFCFALTLVLAVALLGVYRLMVWGLVLDLATHLGLCVFFAVVMPGGLASVLVGLSAAQVALLLPVFVAIARRRAPPDDGPLVRVARAVPGVVLVGMLATGTLCVALGHPLITDP
jgi:hypothetical protein